MSYLLCDSFELLHSLEGITSAVSLEESSWIVNSISVAADLLKVLFGNPWNESGIVFGSSSEMSMLCSCGSWKENQRFSYHIT